MGVMKVELTMEQADLLLLELSALIQDFNHPKETIEQIMDIRQQIAQSIVSEKEARGA
jgi:truncated hemoglobin YjbI